MIEAQTDLPLEPRYAQAIFPKPKTGSRTRSSTQLDHPPFARVKRSLNRGLPAKLVSLPFISSISWCLGYGVRKIEIGQQN